MKGNFTFKTTGNKERQTGLLFVSFIFFVVFLIFLVFDFTLNMLFLFLLSCCFFFFINFYYKNFYDIKIENGFIKLINIWKTKEYPIHFLKKIDVFTLLYPNPFNPFIEFTFNNNEKIVTRLPNYKKIYFSKGGMNLYINNLRNEIFSPTDTSTPGE